MTTIDEANPAAGPSLAANILPKATGHAEPKDEPPSASPCTAQAPRAPHTRVGGATPLTGELLFYAEFLDDIEDLRVRSAERMRSMLRATHPDLVVPEKLSAVKLIAFIRANASREMQLHADEVEALLRFEHQVTLSLRRELRQHPLGAWVKRTVGIGEKQGARLLAAVGDVTYNHAHDRPRRGPAELWAYCGFVPGQRRRKGVRSNWNAQAKMRAFLIAESCMKQRTSPYRAVYEIERAKWMSRETSDLHKHNHALRVVAKAMLRDLFLEAQRVSG